MGQFEDELETWLASAAEVDGNDLYQAGYRLAGAEEYTAIWPPQLKRFRVATVDKRVRVWTVVVTLAIKTLKPKALTATALA